MSLAQLAGLGARRARLPGMAPAPLEPLLLHLGVAAVVLGLEALVGLRGNSLVVAPVSLVLLGLVQAGRRSNVRRRLRAEADAWISPGYENRAGARYGWRIDELTG